MGCRGGEGASIKEIEPKTMFWAPRQKKVGYLWKKDPETGKLTDFPASICGCWGSRSRGGACVLCLPVADRLLHRL